MPPKGKPTGSHAHAEPAESAQKQTQTSAAKPEKSDAAQKDEDKK